MKRQFFYWFVIAIVAMLGLSACEKEIKLELTKQVVEFIESKIVGSGLDKEVVATKTTNADGAEVTVLSYNSWIEVQGRTKADFDNVVSVSVLDTIPCMAELMDAEVEVSDFNLPDARVQSHDWENGMRSESHEGYVLEITNREVVYRVNHVDFGFKYVLHYEVPVYRDSVICDTMPYYQYENITDKGYTVTPKGRVVRGDMAYNSALYRHELEVTMNQKPYTLYAEITLLQEIGPADEPYISSTQIDSIVTDEYDNHVTLTVDASYIWSDGEKRTTHNVVDLYGYLEKVAHENGSFDDNNPHLGYKGISVVDSLLYDERSGDIVIHHRTAEYVVDYGDCTLGFRVISDGATYDDGTLYEDIVGNELKSIEKINESITKEYSALVTGDGKVIDVYKVDVTFRVTFGRYYRDIRLTTRSTYCLK